jgi:hypothetical protein
LLGLPLLLLRLFRFVELFVPVVPTPFRFEEFDPLCPFAPVAEFVTFINMNPDPAVVPLPLPATCVADPLITHPVTVTRWPVPRVVVERVSVERDDPVRLVGVWVCSWVWVCPVWFCPCDCGYV